jgi:hypothetical protein
VLLTSIIPSKSYFTSARYWFVFYVNKNKARFREKMAKIGLEERRVKFDWEGTKVLINLS